MYRLSGDADVSFLVGIDLLQVCVGVNEVILNFDRDVRVLIMADFGVRDADRGVSVFGDPREGIASLVRFLGRTTTNARATPGGGLELDFDSDEVLLVFDTMREHESFVMSAPGIEIVV